MRIVRPIQPNGFNKLGVGQENVANVIDGVVLFTRQNFADFSANNLHFDNVRMGGQERLSVRQIDIKLSRLLSGMVGKFQPKNGPKRNVLR